MLVGVMVTNSQMMGVCRKKLSAAHKLYHWSGITAYFAVNQVILMREYQTYLVITKYMHLGRLCVASYYYSRRVGHQPSTWHGHIERLRKALRK